MPHGEKADHEWGANEEEHALLCLLRRKHGKKVKAAEYGAEGVKPRTTGAEFFAYLCKKYLRVEVHDDGMISAHTDNDEESKFAVAWDHGSYPAVGEYAAAHGLPNADDSSGVTLKIAC